MVASHDSRVCCSASPGRRAPASSRYLMTVRSSATFSSTSGRCTLTATSSPPSASLARYTCPSDAAATGSAKAASASAKVRERGPPSSSSRMARASSEAKGWTLSCRVLSSAVYASGRMSGRMLTAWPILMYAGPASVSSCRSSRARAGWFATHAPSPPARSARSLAPNAAPRDAIVVRRADSRSGLRAK